jgi:hypothetical protein
MAMGVLLVLDGDRSLLPLALALALVATSCNAAASAGEWKLTSNASSVRRPSREMGDMGRGSSSSGEFKPDRAASVLIVLTVLAVALRSESGGTAGGSEGGRRAAIRALRKAS